MYYKVMEKRKLLMINLYKIIKDFKNTSWLFAEKIFVSIWVARYLGPEQYGLYKVS